MAVEKNIKINVDAKGAVQEVDKLKQGVKDTSQEAANSESSFGKMKKGVGAVGTAFKALGIGLIVAAFVKLKDMLGQNQVIMDKVSAVTESLGFVFQKVVNFAVDLGTKMTDAFSNPKESIEELWTALKQNLVNRIEGLIDLFGALGKVIKGVFTRDLDLLKEGASDAGTAFVQLNTGMDEVQQNNFAENIKKGKKELNDATKEATAYGKAITQLKNEVKLAEANQRQLQLTYQKDAELQRQIRDDVSLTFEERIAANEELGRILDEQFAEEKALADKKVELAELELSKNKDNVDLQVALINAKTELADLDERITGQRSEQLTNLKALEKEKADADKAIVDQQIADQKKLTDTEREEAKKREDIAKTERDMKIALANSILSSLGTLAGEGTKAAKAAALAQVMIDTASGISSAIAGATAAAAAAGPAAPIVTPILIAQLVGQVLAGVATAKGILKKVPGPDESGTDNVNIPAGSTGGFSGFGGLTPNIEAITPPGTTTQPIQAFVVENDISDAQALQEELDIQATL
jgi:DNA repair exonuclease SbcCD ATPase subunit